MQIILVGIVILVIGFFIANFDPSLKRYRSIIKTAGVIVILIGISISVCCPG